MYNRHYRNCILSILLIFLFLPQPVSGQDRVFLPLITKGDFMTIRGQHWYVVLPEETENEITNPSIETATTGYAAYNGSAIARSAESQIRGVFSLKVVPTSNTTGGMTYTQTLSASSERTISVDIKGADGVPYIIEARDGSTTKASLSFIGDGEWARYALDSFALGSPASIVIRVRKNSNSSTAPFYVDGLQSERKAYATDYTDGDQEGGVWAAGAHQSRSIRQKFYPAAGRVINLNDYGFLVDVTDGLGIADIRIIATDNAQGDGATFKNSTILSRTMTIQGKFAAGQDGTTLTSDAHAKRELHRLRSQMLSLLYPGRYPSNQPVYFRYDGSGKTLQAGFYFNPSDRTGNRLTMVLPNGLRLYAPDPYVEQVSRIFTESDVASGIGTGSSSSEGAASKNGGGGGENAAELTAQQTVSSVNYVIQKSPDGTWSVPQVGSGLNGAVKNIAQRDNGDYIFGGDFTTANGSTVNHLVGYDGSSYYDLDSGVNAAPDTPDGIAISPSGTIYVAGPDEFGGVALTEVTGVGEYDPVGDNWTILEDDPDLGEGAFNITVDPVTGYPVISNASGGTYWVQFWDGSQWVQYGGISQARGIIFGLDGKLYVSSASPSLFRLDGGSFTDLDSPSGVTELLDLTLGFDGTIYVVGKHSSSDYRIYGWNGTSFTQVGDIFNDYPRNIFTGPNGELYAVGNFTQIGDLTLSERAAKFSGGSWVNINVDLPGAPTVYVIHVANDGTITFGFDTTGTATAGVINPIVNNGNAATYPVIKYTGDGRLYELTNQDTDDEIYFDYSLQPGETVTLDLQPGIKSITSTFNGNLFSKNAVLPGSDFATFRLLPGDNDISNLIDDSGASGTIQWKNLFVSFDG